MRQGIIKKSKSSNGRKILLQFEYATYNQELLDDGKIFKLLKNSNKIKIANVVMNEYHGMIKENID